MKVGSIVVVKHLPPGIPEIESRVTWKPIQDEKTLYTIRELIENKELNMIGALLEEGIIGYNERGAELSVNIKYLIEVMPPDTIVTELLDEVPELVTE